MSANNNKLADQPWSGSATAIAQLSDLCARQIDAGIEEAFGEISDLSQSLLRAAGYASDLGAARKDPQHHAAVCRPEQVLESMSEAMSLALVKLQFADRLGQRLSNVRDNLARLAELMSSPDVSVTEKSWSDFLVDVRASFTMEDERRIFDAIVGNSAEKSGSGTAGIPEIFGGDRVDEH